MSHDPARPAMLTWSRSAPLLLFTAAAIGIYGIALYVRAILPSLEQPGAIAAGLTLDLVLVVPALWYVLVVRRKGWPWISVVPVFIASLLLAARVVPAGHHATLSVLELAAIPLELGLLGYIAWKAIRAVRAMRAVAGDVRADALRAFKTAARGIVPNPRVADMAAYELSVLHYGLVSWFQRRPIDRTSEFTSHERDAYASVLVGLFFVLAIELVPVHMLLHGWQPVAAWIVTGLSLYSAVWLLADFQALRRRPIRLTGDALHVRAGLRWDVEIPLSEITSMEQLGGEPEDVARSALQIKVLSAPNMRLRTRAPVRVEGMYGFARVTDDIYFALDDPAGFRDAWDAANDTPNE